MAPGIIMSAILCFAPAAGTNRAPSVGEIVQKSAQVTDADRKAYPEYDFNETDRESDGSTKTNAVHRRVRRVSESGRITRLKDGRAALPTRPNNRCIRIADRRGGHHAWGRDGRHGIDRREGCGAGAVAEQDGRSHMRRKVSGARSGCGGCCESWPSGVYELILRSRTGRPGHERSGGGAIGPCTPTGGGWRARGWRGMRSITGGIDRLRARGLVAHICDGFSACRQGDAKACKETRR
jgi:hypothetical protein